MGRLINPLNAMALLTVIYTAYVVIATYYGEDTSGALDYFEGAGFNYILAWWVYGDRHRRGFPVPFEFEALVFFAWPIAVPYYLFSTRGWRAATLIIIALAIVVFLPYLVSLAVYTIFWQ